MAALGAFLIGCAALLVNSGSGVRADHMKEQGDSRGAASEEDLCAGTRINARGLTNDVPGCPTGGLLTGTEGADILTGEKGKDEVRALGTPDGQADVLYGGDGADILLVGGKGADVIYGGDGDDLFEEAADGQRDELYCGKGRDEYSAEKIDYVSGSCEKGRLVDTGGPPLLLLAGAALCSALMMIRYVVRSA
jgi:Ca2+-binding RTX toxin-like protein